MPIDGVVGRRCVLTHLPAPSIRGRFDQLVGQSIGLIKTDLLPKVEGVIMILS